MYVLEALTQSTLDMLKQSEARCVGRMALITPYCSIY